MTIHDNKLIIMMHITIQVHVLNLLCENFFYSFQSVSKNNKKCFTISKFLSIVKIQKKKKKQKKGKIIQ